MKTVIIEFGNSHDECLYSQLLFLKEKGHEVTLVCSEELKKQVEPFSEADEIRFYPFYKKGFSRMMLLFKLWRFLVKNNFDKIIFNKAQNKIVQNFLGFPFPKKTGFAGTIHNPKKLQTSLRQKLITRKIKKYFVLNDYLKEAVRPAGFEVESYYPVFFPQVEVIPLSKEPDEVWICIPGPVDFNRRNYVSLFSALEQKVPDARIKFILLRKCNPESENGKISDPG
ncbi:MAG: glycosyltransferase family 4 protein [Candidatus Azobacteroides sp.]|nr:glycosyltransferase family 4 protein [Candidatus Azobacteroides sp.]